MKSSLHVGVALWICLSSLSACDDESTATAGSDAYADVDADVGTADDLIEVPTPACLTAEGQAEPAVFGRVYIDVDGSDQTIFAQQFDPEIDSPLSAIDVALLGETGELDGVTCDSGDFTFGGLADGVYLLDVGLTSDDALTTKNQSTHLPDAIREGEVTLVTFGDSLPVFGDEPYYPSRVADLLDELATVNNVNVAVGGTTSDDWLPDGSLFENRLAPELADADVVLISLGGNDVLYYMSEAAEDPSRAGELINGLNAFILEVHGRIMTIIAAIREINPTADIVYGLYPNYATSDTWAALAGAFTTFIRNKLDEALTLVRETIDPSDRIIVVDLYGATANLDLDDYLYDELHFNDAGHQLYAEEILWALGGARVGDDPVGLEHNLGVSNRNP